MINFISIIAALYTKVKQKSLRVAREFWRNVNGIFFGSVPDLVKTQKGLRVLVYHGVCKSNPFAFNSRFLSERQFESHLIAFKRHYHLLSLKDFQEGNLERTKFNILLTFDDGLKNNVKYALPLLIKHNIPAVFFITGPIKEDSPYLFNDLLDVFSFLGPARISIDEMVFIKEKRGPHFRYYNSQGLVLGNYCRGLNSISRAKLVKQILGYAPIGQFAAYGDYLDIMNEQDIRALSNVKGMSIGGHGKTHVDLACLSLPELKRELNDSKFNLEKITEQTCDVLAFPYGSYNLETLQASRQAGYVTLFGTEKAEGRDDDKDVVERMTINPYISALNQLYYIAKGSYE